MNTLGISTIEEPAVRTPDDATRAFCDSKIDCLAMGDLVCRQPGGDAHAPN